MGFQMRTRIENNKIIIGLATAVLLTGFGSTAAYSEDQAAMSDKSQCTVRDLREYTAIVICPSGLDSEQWHQAGVEACGALLPCQAWIWSDAEIAPETAPDAPTDMTREQIAGAQAIWVNEKQQLITIAVEKN